jgi:hypothetical protein
VINAKIFNKITMYIIVIFVLSSMVVFGQTHSDIVNGNLIQFNDNGAWCWYQDERAIIDTTGGKLIVGSVASNNGVGGPPRSGDVDAVIFDLQSMRLQRDVLRQGGGAFYCDDHNVPGLLVRPDGKYTAFYAAHNQETSSYFRICDAGVWGTEYEFDWNAERPGGVNYNTTYSNLYYLSNEGRMYNFARGHDGGSPNFMYSDDGGDNWTYGGQLARSNIGGYSRGYYKYWGNGFDRIDFICTETHPRNYNTSIYHGYIQNGNVYNSFETEIDTSIYDTLFIPTTDNFTTVFAANTVLNSYTMTHCWNMDVQRYGDGTIVTIISARTDNNPDDPNHCFIYCRFDGSSWESTYLVNAGKKMYDSEQDYVGLAAIHPNNPNIIYLSTPYDPRDDSTFLGVREIFKGVTADSGVTWNWTPITQNSVRDNFRPIIPMWDEDNMTLLWWRGTYDAAQHYDAAVVGIIERASDTTVLMSYIDADMSNTFLADGSPLIATGPDPDRGPTDDQWHWRSTYGNGGYVLTSAEIDGEDAPVIKTRMTAIQNGDYDIWVNFWANPEEDWRVKAGLVPDSMQIFRQMACKQVMDGDHDTPLVLTGGGNTFLYQAYLGRVQIEADDTLEVFVDDEAILTGTASTPVGGICRTWYDGISFAQLNNLGIVDLPENEEFQLGFKLGQNYPNPFNSNTTINYSLSKISYVSLKVYNLLGQEVATLVDEEKCAGPHSIKWSPQDLPSGVYFCIIKVNNHSDAKKMLIVK